MYIAVRSVPTPLASLGDSMTTLVLLSLPSSAAPGSMGEPETRLKQWIEGNVGTEHGVASIALPDLKIGTLDNLVQQSEEVAKLDSQLQGTMLKAHESMSGIFDSAGKIETAEKVDNRPAWQYLQQFGWNTAKYRPDKPISALLSALSQEALSADQDLKGRLATYQQAKSRVQAFERKFSGDLTVRALDAVVRPTDLVQNSTNLESVLLVVPANQERDFLSSYETTAPMVVPRSAHKITGDTTHVLYSVTLFRKFANEFESKARERRWIVRESPVVSNQAEQRKKLEEQREQESEAISSERRLRIELEKLAAVTFSDIIKAWGHVKVIRVFVESVLRYGLPPSYVTASFVPKIAIEKADAKLVEEFGFLGGNAVARDKRGRAITDESDLAEYAALVENDYRPFVIYTARLP